MNTDTTTAEYTFERIECSRCLGTGKYSWNAMDGDKCYGCNGKGTKLTKAGAAVYATWLAIARPTIQAQDLTPGMKLRISSFGKWLVCEVASVGPDELNVGQNRLNIRFTADSDIGGYGAFATSEFTLAKTVESHRAAWDAVRGMPGIVAK